MPENRPLGRKKNVLEGSAKIDAHRVDGGPAGSGSAMGGGSGSGGGGKRNSGSRMPLPLLLVLVLVFVLWGLMFNKLLVLSINQSFARSRGIDVMLTEGIFAAMVAVVVAISIQWVGLLIINSLLVLPAAAARNVSNSVKQYHAVSIGSAMISGISGLMLAYHFNMAAGATIVVISAVIFFITLLLKPRFVR